MLSDFSLQTTREASKKTKEAMLLSSVMKDNVSVSLFVTLETFIHVRLSLSFFSRTDLSIRIVRQKKEFSHKTTKQRKHLNLYVHTI